MEENPITLTIISPEKTLFSGKVQSVKLPGSKCVFVVLKNHAPIISSLAQGAVVWKTGEEEERMKISGGFAEVKNNIVTVCAETENNDKTKK